MSSHTLYYPFALLIRRATLTTHDLSFPYFCSEQVLSAGIIKYELKKRDENVLKREQFIDFNSYLNYY